MKLNFIPNSEEVRLQKVLLNDALLEGAWYYNKSLICHSKETSEILYPMSIQFLKDNFDLLNLLINQSVSNWDVRIRLFFTPQSLEGIVSEKTINSPCIALTIHADKKNWASIFSINTLEKTYQKIILEKNSSLYFEMVEFPALGSAKGIVMPLGNSKNNLSEAIVDILKTYQNLTQLVEQELSYLNSADILTTVFEFPQDYKIACKQYLIYFAQFLADIGINAQASIKEDANKILFTVVPQDGDEALDKIKEALEIYMNAPANPVIEVLQNEKKDLAVIQWEANIHHLKSQVMLAQAAIQMKDATIEALQLSNYRLKEEITSAKQIAEKAIGLNEEKIIGGSVAIKKYDGKWFSVDLPAFIRKLKRKK